MNSVASKVVATLSDLQNTAHGRNIATSSLEVKAPPGSPSERGNFVFHINSHYFGMHEESQEKYRRKLNLRVRKALDYARGDAPEGPQKASLFFLFPVCLQNHWILIYAHLPSKRILLLDSLQDSIVLMKEGAPQLEGTFIPHVFRLLDSLGTDLGLKTISKQGLCHLGCYLAPQDDNSSCGLYVCYSMFRLVNRFTARDGSVAIKVLDVFKYVRDFHLVPDVCNSNDGPLLMKLRFDIARWLLQPLSFLPPYAVVR